MNAAHWHLVVNHFPLIFPLVGVLVMIIGLLSKSEAVKRTAFVIFILGALSAVAAMSTGNGAEEVVEKIRGVEENYIENHEESAETFALLSYILGGFSLLGLLASFKQKALFNFSVIVTLIFALVVLFFGKKAGTTGGEIRHPEIRSENSVPAPDQHHETKDEE